MMLDYDRKQEREKMKHELETREQAAIKSGAVWGFFVAVVVIGIVLAVATKMEAVNDVALFLSGALVLVCGTFGVVWVVMGLSAVTRWLRSALAVDTADKGEADVID